MRKNSIRLVIAGLCLVAAAVRAYAYEDGDFQVWHTENQEARVCKDTTLALEEEFRFGDDASEFFYHHYDAGLLYDVNKNLSLGVNYRQVYELKGDKFKGEERPHISAILKGDLGGFQLDDRNRLEYRHFNYQSDFWRYRNKFTARFPWKFTKFKIQPYLADEIFVDFKETDFSRNRFYSGLGFNLTKNIKADVYYLLQVNKSSGKWTKANVLGTKLKVVF